jgi:hypothetical protein
MDSLPEGRRNARTFADATTKRIQEIKNGLVLQVALRQGAFWEEVCDTRARWAIQAPVKFPPEDDVLLYPERLRRSTGEGFEAQVYDRHNWDEDIKRLSLWLAIPGLDRYREDVDWWPSWPH